jgi:K(+)-stimulated pyrophosphate-energized sodium pump
MPAASAALLRTATDAITVGSGAKDVLRLAIAVAAACVAFGAVNYSRVRVARVDREGRLENEAHLA